MPKTVTRTRSRKDDAATARPAADHFHHWKIDEPSGLVSTGVCKHCGVTKEFRNWLSDGDFITNEEHRSAA